MSNSAADSADTTAPLLTGRPANGQAADGALVFTFSEAVKLAPNASFTIRANHGAGVTVMLNGNPAVTHNGATITYQPPQRLAYGTSYTVDFSVGAVSDLAGNVAYPGAILSTQFVSGYSPVAINFTGTPASDMVEGSDLADTIDGGAGSDVLNGHGGDDLLYGGEDAGAQYNTMDRLSGGAGNDSLWGGRGDDQLDGGSGNDKLYGEADNDSLNGGAGDDLLEGGDGNDELIEGSGANILRGGDGADRLRSLDWDATGLLDGGNGDDTLEGYAGIEYVGGAGNDLFHLELHTFGRGNTSADGGAGKDRFHLLLTGVRVGATTLTGGADSDTYALVTSEFTSDTGVTVTDFTPGVGGDLIDLRQVYTGYSDGNPFDNGRVRLLASGNDTLFQQRHPVTGNYVTVLTLTGVKPAQLLAANFVDGFNPLGGTVGLSVSGGAGPDTLSGTRLDDTLLGLGGDDRLAGGKGNDLLEGGDGNDTLEGEEGNNTLRGGEGDDKLYSGLEGSNVLEGGNGNDALYSSGSDTLAGGAGDDLLVLNQYGIGQARNRVAMAGGDGKDIIRFEAAYRPVDVSASGGAGADLFEFRERAEPAAVTITDFGSTDQLDLRQLMPYGMTGNPFGPGGYLKAVQEGADVRIYLDKDGAAGAGAARLVVTLANFSLASLALTNFSGGYDPGGGTRGLTLTGSAGADVLTGTILDDSIDGGDGADRIDGGAGDDLLLGGDESVAGAGDELEGGAGNDTLRGGTGNDLLRGGEGMDRLFGDAGDDILNGGMGDDLLEGGDGKDILDDFNGTNEMRGGAGDDTLGTSYGEMGSSLLDGGAGNDTILVGQNAGSVFGGAGDDAISLLPTLYGDKAGALRAEGGDGNDTFTISGGVTAQRAIVLAGGAGIDRYVFQPDYNGGWAALTISDFQAGSGGDVIDLYSLFPETVDSPIASGHVRIVQDGTRTLVQVDRDGAAGPQGFDTRLILEGVLPAALSHANFTEGLHPDGSLKGMELNGSSGADQLIGGRLNDTLRGNDGADVLTGNAGDDSLFGGLGGDWLDGGNGNDRLEGGDDNDILTDYVGNNVFYGGGGDDRITAGSSGTNQVFGEDGNDVIVAASAGTFDGGEGKDTLSIGSGLADQAGTTAQVRGGAGEDRISISMSNPTGLKAIVEGGSGKDLFVLGMASAPGMATITDFTAGYGGDLLDVIALGRPGGRNPFAADGHLQLVQRGADTVLQVRSAGTWQDALLLQNTSKAALSPHNFVLGFGPEGSHNGLIITGTAAGERLHGGWLDDTIDGAGGNDELLGGVGHDKLYGGDGNDRLDGDYLDGVLRPDGVSGWPDQETGHDQLDGGAGNDILVSRWGNDILAGGAGDDQLTLASNPGSTSFLMNMDGGDGRDTLNVLGDAGATSAAISGGAGSDTFTVDPLVRAGTVAILDFQVGEGGDVLDIFRSASPSSAPFIDGFYRLEQRGADTVVRFDADGAAGSEHDLVDLLTLRNVAKESLVAANMRGGYLPDSPPPAPAIVRSGGSGADRLEGDSGSDRLDGGAGNDVLRGGAGADGLLGGPGIDTALYGGTRADYAIGMPYQAGSTASVLDRRGGVNDGRDTLLGVERLVFSDGAIALDVGLQDVASQAYRIYRAAFDRAPDEAGLGYWIGNMDRGMSQAAVAAYFVRAPEFTQLYGAAPTNAEIVTRMYRNILDRDPEKAGFDYWLDLLDRKVLDAGGVLSFFSESNENRAAVADLIANGIHYQPYGG